MSDHGDARIRVSRNILRVRRARGISQERLGELADSSAKHIGQIERCEVDVGVDVLERLASALSIDVADLFASPQQQQMDRSLVVADVAALDKIDEIIRAIRRAPLFPPKDDPS